jgi:hypothetical protein
MKWWFVLAIVLPFAHPPKKMPEQGEATKAKLALATGNAKSADDNQQPSAPTLIAQPSSNTGSKAGTTKPSGQISPNSQQTPDESLGVQRKLALFTAALVVIGILQTIVMFLTWWIYRRQAREMRRQRHEMRRQRHVMFRQWKAMGVQAALMTGQLEEMKESRKIETKTLILQYRPRIIVRNASASDFNVAELGQPAQGKVQITIINSGGSPAHIKGGTIALWSTEVSSAPTEIKKGNDNPIGEFTLQAGEDREYEGNIGTGATHDLNWANYHAGHQTTPMKSLYLVGTIMYEDDLGIPRRTGIFRAYDPKTYSFSSSTFEGEYTD